MLRRVYKPSRPAVGMDTSRRESCSAGDLLKLARLQHGYSLRRLSELTGYSASYLCQIENKKEPVRPSVLSTLRTPLALTGEQWARIYCKGALEYLRIAGWQEELDVTLARRTASACPLTALAGPERARE